ncbi:MAG: type I citrate synthase [Chloroflexi bacterium GWB2_49_20]|nr:MAG: type I citrate synthase [Chloroflexi bacterium GWB2_49_20]OGN78974.1 MAG: type I citrate synthase [Chloroflexi bacterium GWC2_49_37]OGN86265.1 MAG: type I citrate synthase [Chloroflexi bacterium GWD2_49_16]
MIIHEKIAEQLPGWRERVKKLVKEKGDIVIDKVTIDQVYGGMRGSQVLVSDISYVDPAEGIRLRGYSIPEVLAKLPKPDEAEMPYVGGLYYLLLTGEMPTKEQACLVEKDWANRSEIPQYVYNTLRALPKNTHPMTLFTLAVQSLQTQSEFAKRYHEGMRKDEYWEPMLEDSLNLTAKLPIIAAFIYSLKYRNGEVPQVDSSLDWGANFAHMLGIKDKGYEELARLYFIIHSDHESGNVSAHATHLVGSSLADVYYAFSAGLNGLAGPLHGLANQECFGWLLEVRDKFGGVPSKEQLRKFAWETLESGKVIPGYGHAVLRVPDPRFTAQMKFAKDRFPQDELVRLADMVFEIVPQVLKEQGKAKNPAPNVDAISGTLQYYYGVREFDFYTVLFGVGRALGVTANLVWARALGQPLERPKSLTTQMLEDAAVSE